MALVNFGEIPVTNKNEYDLRIFAPQQDEVVTSPMFISGKFAVDEGEKSSILKARSGLGEDFYAYMNTILKCQKRTTPRDGMISVGFEEEYTMTDFVVDVDETLNSEGRFDVEFTCYADGIREGETFLWIALMGILADFEMPRAQAAVKVKCNQFIERQNMVAEFLPSTYVPKDQETMGAFYDTVMNMFYENTNFTDGFQKRANEFLDLLRVNADVVYSGIPAPVACVIREIANGEYLYDLPNEELQRFDVRLEIHVYDSNNKEMMERRHDGQDKAIICTPDVYQLNVDGETRQLLIFNEMIWDIFTIGDAKSLKIRFVIYYDNEEVGKSVYKKIKIHDRRPTQVVEKPVPKAESEIELRNRSVMSRYK